MEIGELINQNYMVWIDTSSLMEDGFDLSFTTIINSLKTANSKIYVEGSVINELKNYVISVDLVKSNGAKRSLDNLKKLKLLGLIEYYNPISTSFADNQIYTAFSQ